MAIERRALALLGLFAAGCQTRGGDVLSLLASATAGAGGGGVDAGAAAGAPSDAGPPLPSTVYLSPDGDDQNPGTQALPWLTFAHALPLLQPGSTLILLDGTYTNANSGFLQVFCGTNAVDGAPDRPITVRAQSERQAFIKGDGTGAPIELSACSNWIIDGIHAEEADAPHEMGDEPGSVVVLTRCANVLARRLLAAHPNRYLTASVYVIAHGQPNVTIEESEALDFHYYGFHAYDAQQAVFRRDYAHSRDTPDIMGGTPTTPPTEGDGGFLLSKSSYGTIENCVAEDVADGFTIAGSRIVMGGRVQPMHDQLLGDIANGVSHAGYILDSQCASTKPCTQGDQIVSTAVLANDVSIGGALGVMFTGGVDDTVESTSLFDFTDTGVSLAIDAENMGLTSNATVRATLVDAAGAPFGFHATGLNKWAFDRCDAFGPAMTFAPRDGHVTSALEIDPQLGGCLVYVPAASPLKAASDGGTGSAGADIVDEYVNGQLTSTKLWDQATGAFPCGATVAGLNDAALVDVSCVGVAARLHVGAMGCAIP
ncbi:MAG TPA: hypothetical protein VLA14_17770 [Polyangia bacterium]|nr:hypothetical protein [Polyangia bacterium]